MNGKWLMFIFIASMILTAWLFWAIEKDEAEIVAFEQARARNSGIEMVVNSQGRP